MANIKIITGDDKEHLVKGRLTFEAKLIETEDGEEIVIVGQMTTHKYIEDISTLETYRYVVEGVSVFREVFASDDFDILYEFIAKDYLVKNGETNLGNELIESIEKEKYKNDDSNLWEGKEMDE